MTKQILIDEDKVKLALKELETWKRFTHGKNEHTNKAITALEEALAQPKRDLKPRCFADFQLNHEHDRKCQWCAVETECKTGMAQLEQEPVGYVQTVIEALYENGDPISVDAAELLQRISAQPEQEPVAYIHRNEYNEYRLEPHDNFDIKSIPFNVDVSLFKSPQRTWVGLDNDDLVWIYSNSDKVGQAISNTEAKLKEKNT